MVRDVANVPSYTFIHCGSSHQFLSLFVFLFFVFSFVSGPRVCHSNLGMPLPIAHLASQTLGLPWLSH